MLNYKANVTWLLMRYQIIRKALFFLVTMWGIMYQSEVEGSDSSCRDLFSQYWPLFYTLSCLLQAYLPTRKKTWHGVSFYNLFVTVHSVFLQINLVCQTDVVLLLPLRYFPLFFFLTGDDNSAFLPRVEITVFSKNFKVNVKLIHTFGLGVRFLRYEVDYRSADVAKLPKTLGWKVTGRLVEERF